MEKINCDVHNCSHNNDNVCFANRVDVGGYGATTSENTCCGSFLDKNLYGNLTNNINGGGACDCLVCKAKECRYNDNQLCSLNSINVSGTDPKIYSETFCASFKE